MIRKYLFLGLTLVLIVALTNLIIRGCRLEKEKAQQLVETVEEAKPTATRVLQPQDLRIALSQIVPETKKDKDGKQSSAARHEMEIYNGGVVPYTEMQLKIDYRDRNGNTVETRTHTISRIVSPGSVLKAVNFTIEDVPSSATDALINILSADIAPSASPNN